MNEVEYDEYDMWLSSNSGNAVRDVLELKEELNGAKSIYESKLFPKWKRNITIYKSALDYIQKSDINICGIYDEEYPYMLKNIYDPPYILYYRGRLPDNSKRTFSIVGARKATVYGKSMSYDIGKTLGRNGVVVVSGMALGADSCAHRGCLDGGGITVAVLGSGVDLCTPSSNLILMNRILENEGCVISEFIPGTPGYAANYPKRNRIISGMSESTIVVEADEKSGTSITARMALEQGRDVFALPGNINSVMSRGTNRLIKEGAIPLISKEDLLDDLDIRPRAEEKKTVILDSEEKEIYEYINKKGVTDIDEICGGLGKYPWKVSGILTILELKGLIMVDRGKIIIAK